MLKYIIAVAALSLPVAAQAQQSDRMHGSGVPHVEHVEGIEHAKDTSVQEPGQSAFAAIQEIVALLESDADTDWTEVNIDGLRQHLIDMDNVTLRSEVTATDVPGGKRYLVTGPSSIRGSINRMINGHADTMDGVNGMSISVTSVPGGTLMTVMVSKPKDLSKLDGLGFIGFMTLGMHHQDHHLMVARGKDPHG